MRLSFPPKNAPYLIGLEVYQESNLHNFCKELPLHSLDESR